MAQRINKDAFIANILECFTLLQTYEECYKEILDIIDVVNGLNESDLTVENLQKLVEGSEYISLDLNEAGTKLVISLDRTHVDETVKEDSTNLVTSGAVFDAIANANGNVLRLPINVPTEPLVVMIGTNNAQTNVPLGDGLAVVNNHLVATGGGSGGDVTKAYVDEQDAKLQQSINQTDTQVQSLNEEVATIKTDTIPALNNQLVATNTEVSKKLDKMTGTGDGVKVYINQGETDRLLNATSDKTRNLIVMWDKLAQLHANAGTTDDAVVNKKQMEDAIEGIFTSDNIWTSPQRYMLGHDLISIFNTGIEMQETPATYKFGQLTIADTGDNQAYINRYDLPIVKTSASKHIILTDQTSAKVVQITQSAYDALTTKNANTLYVIVG